MFTLNEFEHERHYRPKTWEEVFEFVAYMNVRHIFMERARAQAEASQDG